MAVTGSGHGTLIGGVFPKADAARVYADLKTGALKAIGALLEYPVPAEGAPPAATSRVLPRAEPPSVLNNGSARKRRIEIGFTTASPDADSVFEDGSLDAIFIVTRHATHVKEEAEGSRFTGEGGHFINTLSWWAGSPVEEVYAVRGPERVSR